MNQAKTITKGQLRRLYAQWNLYAVEGDDREARLRWASLNLGRQVTSWATLTSAEFKTLDGILQVGLELPQDDFLKGPKGSPI